MSSKDRVTLAYVKTMREKYPMDELWSEFYHYFNAVVNYPGSIDVIMCADLVENLIGVRDHEDILREVYKYGNYYRLKE